jgi:hypothetical protein
VMDGTILVSVKLHGSALVCFSGCCALPVGCFALFCFVQGIEMRSRPRRSLRSSRKCASMRLEPDTLSGRSPSWIAT